MAVGRSITQATFNDVVASNIEDFDMEEEEACAAALEEFKLQGADLAGIACNAESKKGLEKHPLIAMTKDLQTPGNYGVDCAKLLVCLSTYLGSLKSEELVVAQKVAVQEETIQLLLHILKEETRTADVTFHCLDAMLVLLTDQTIKAQFCMQEGALPILQALRQYSDRTAILVKAAGVIDAACTKSEENKELFMSSKVGQVFCENISSPSISVSMISAVSRAVVRLTTADDSRPVVSRAYQNSKALTRTGLHLKFLKVLASNLDSEEACAACCSALRKLACNDDFCAEIGEAGGIQMALKILKSCNASCAAAASGLLRQLAGNDAMKQEIHHSGGLAILRNVLEEHTASASCMEQSLGLLAAMTLRYPEASVAAIEAGLPAAMLQVMQAVQQQWVQRQACIAFRNLIARCKEYSQALLDLGTEQAIKAAKTNFPMACQDVGSAALRDLGCDNYNS